MKPSRILTTMPSHRIIAYGESDEITCCIPGQHTVTVTSDITAEALTYNAIGGEEPVSYTHLTLPTTPYV